MKYTYNDIPDKSKAGMDKELHSGLIKAGIYMHQTMGFPIESFKEEIDNMTDRVQQWEFYMNFRNKYPKAFV